MAATHDVYGDEFENPVIEVYDVRTVYEDKVPVKTEVVIHISDANDSNCISLDGSTLPATTQYNAVEAWAENEFKRFEI